MTPQSYLKIKAAYDRVIACAKDACAEAREHANDRPAKLRRAEADDIQVGAVIWRETGIGDAWYWNVVERPLHYGDDWKAYISDDGCRYGLWDAWVEDKEGA